MLPIHASTSRLHVQNQWLWTGEGYAVSHRSSYRTEVFDALGSVEADGAPWSVPETGLRQLLPQPHLLLGAACIQ